MRRDAPRCAEMRRDAPRCAAVRRGSSRGRAACEDGVRRLPRPCPRTFSEPSPTGEDGTPLPAAPKRDKPPPTAAGEAAIDSAQARSSRDAAEMRPRCSRDAAEMQPRCVELQRSSSHSAEAQYSMIRAQAALQSAGAAGAAGAALSPLSAVAAAAAGVLAAASPNDVAYGAGQCVARRLRAASSSRAAASFHLQAWGSASSTGGKTTAASSSGWTASAANRRRG